MDIVCVIYCFKCYVCGNCVIVNDIDGVVIFVFFFGSNCNINFGIDGG